MAGETPSTPARRLALALCSPALGPDAEALVRELARALRAELAGVFVEDADLVRLAELPVTVEVGHASGAVWPLSVESLQSDLRRQADQARRSLAALAEELLLPWTFEVARGRICERALDLAYEATIVVLAARPAPPAARAVRQGARPLAVLVDAAAGARAVGPALQYALAGGDGVLALVAPPAQAHREAIRAAAGDAAGRVRIAELP
ncbi:MAG: hypothetical protein AB7Q97_23895, partial [Gammaproteobacteria bacterium]